MHRHSLHLLNYESRVGSVRAFRDLAAIYRIRCQAFCSCYAPRFHREWGQVLHFNIFSLRTNSCSQPHWTCQPVIMPDFGSKLLVCSGPGGACSLIIPNAPTPGPSPNPVMSRPVRTRALNSFFQAAHQFFTPVRNATCPMISGRVWRLWILAASAGNQKDNSAGEDARHGMFLAECLDLVSSLLAWEASKVFPVEEGYGSDSDLFRHLPLSKAEALPNRPESMAGLAA